VNDSRLNNIAQLVKPQKTIPTVVEFVDIAGLVKGASKGEGLGNQFLGHIREVNAIIHVVRCFENDDIAHVNGKINPANDIEVINIELALADLEVVNKRLGNIPRLIKNHNKEISSNAKMTLPILEKLQKGLEEGIPARAMGFSEDERDLIKDLGLITSKEMLYLCNVDEDSISSDNEFLKQVKKIAENENAMVLKICGQLESEIASLDSQNEKDEFLKAAGIEEPGINRLTATAYNILNLKTFFTAGEKEVRAWTFHNGDRAPQAAGVIHSDFERGFIKAEVYHCDELFELGSEIKVKENGKLRIEGKEYLAKDGDIFHFRFNV
jgi:hypothetical protein